MNLGFALRRGGNLRGEVSVLFFAMKFIWFTSVVVATGLFVAGCGRKAPEKAETEAAAEASPVAEVEAAEVVEIVESPNGAEAAPSAVLLESKIEPMSPESIPGLYRDPAAPEVLYEFREDDRWVAIWQPEDQSRGLMMEGVYQVEKGGVVHLRVMQFGRRDDFLGDDWDRRTPPHPRPRGFFRIEDNALVMISDKTAQAFNMAPFTAARLVKVAQ